jgi:hypothetical protein
VVLIAGQGKGIRYGLNTLGWISIKHMYGLLLGRVKDDSIFGNPLTDSMKASCLLPAIGPNK